MLNPSFLAAAFLAFVPLASSQQIIVSPTGSVNTLAEARDAARAQRQQGFTGVITITIRGGTYFLPEMLVLAPEDSNVTWQAARGEHPVISGGRAVSGWAKSVSAAWTVQAPGPYFHQLFVDGQRADRTRTPNTGFFRFDGTGAPFQQLRLHYHADDLNPAWTSLGDVEVVGYIAWNDFRAPILSIDPQSHTVVFPVKEGFAKEQNARYFVENLPGALLVPGEWYLDRQSQQLSYLPLPGQDMDRTQTVAARLLTLITLDGHPESGKFVHDVTFRGLTFSHTDWNIGSSGVYNGQGASQASAALRAVGATSLHIDHCLFTHLGGYALELGRGSKHNQITASEFTDLGAGGIRIGEPTLRPDDAEQNYDNLIADNDIHHIGRVYSNGMGILMMQSARNRVLHNVIHDTFQTAISVGWTWGYGPSLAASNLIAYNHIYDIGQDLTSDIGAVYTLGVQPGTVIQNNLIHNVSSFTYGGWGIYLDEGSSHILVQDNVVYACKSAGFHEHFGEDNLVRNNIFALNREHQLMRTTFEPGHISFGIEGNIIYSDSGTVLGGEWAKGNFALDKNLYFDTRGSGDVQFLSQSFAQWQASGHDKGSRIADPLFVAPAEDDFRLQPDSPALKMGFHQIDVSKVGPRVSAGVGDW